MYIDHILTISWPYPDHILTISCLLKHIWCISWPYSEHILCIFCAAYLSHICHICTIFVSIFWTCGWCGWCGTRFADHGGSRGGRKPYFVYRAVSFASGFVCSSGMMRCARDVVPFRGAALHKHSMDAKNVRNGWLSIFGRDCDLLMIQIEIS